MERRLEHPRWTERLHNRTLQTSIISHHSQRSKQAKNLERFVKLKVFVVSSRTRYSTRKVWHRRAGRSRRWPPTSATRWWTFYRRWSPERRTSSAASNPTTRVFPRCGIAKRFSSSCSTPEFWRRSASANRDFPIAWPLQNSSAGLKIINLNNRSIQ